MNSFLRLCDSSVTNIFINCDAAFIITLNNLITEPSGHSTRLFVHLSTKEETDDRNELKAYVSNWMESTFLHPLTSIFTWHYPMLNGNVIYCQERIETLLDWFAVSEGIVREIPV